MNSPMMILGAGGMLGRALAGAGVSAGRPVIALAHHDCDITQPAQLEAALRRHRPAVVFNCAAISDVDRCQHEPDLAMAVNAQAVGPLAELVMAAGARLVHFSSDFVFDGQSGRPYTESDQPRPLSVYGQSKYLSEQLLARHCPAGRWLLVRTSGLFGPHGRCFPRTVLEQAGRGQPLQVVNDLVMCPTYVADLAAMVYDLIGRGMGGVWHVCNSGPTTWLEYARAILREFAIDIPLQGITSQRWRQIRPGQAPRPLYSVLDCSKLCNLVGQVPRKWTDALRDYRTLVRPI